MNDTDEPPLLDNVDDTEGEDDYSLNENYTVNEAPPEKLGIWELLTKRADRTSIFVLIVCFVTYMFNQVDRYLIAITSKEIERSQNWGDQDGGGSKYDFLVGVVFTVIYLPAGIPMGILADRMLARRHQLLALALLIWSLSVIWTGLSTSYYEVVAGRFILALAQSACTPLAVSIITDYFPKETRATALGVYNWGIYTGYGLALGVGNALTKFTSWRVVWLVFGIGGVGWSVVVLFLPMKKQRAVTNTSRKNSVEEKVGGKNVLQYFFTTPSIVLLLIGSLIRNAGGYVWAFNTTIFFRNVRHQGHVKQAKFMGWIPLVCGSLGSVFGGYISDKFVKGASSHKRLLVLILSNLCAAPFALLALTIPRSGYPGFYLSLIPSNIIGEMWVGVTLTIIVELVPKHMKTTGLSIYFFLIGLAGFVPTLVTPFTDLFNSYQFALIILFPGLYALSSVFFFLAFCFVERDKKKALAMQKHSINLLNEDD